MTWSHACHMILYRFQIAMSEDGSGESTNGEQDVENSPQKSPAPGEKSPGQSSSSSAHADDEGGSPYSSGGGGGGRGLAAARLDSTSGGGATGTGEGGASVTGVTERPSSSLTPQQFMRVAKDSKSTCARTDLVYVHPPAAERELAASTTKVCAESAI